jgi:hypothetical protein
MHRYRLRYHGSVSYEPPSAETRFWSKVDKNGAIPAHVGWLGQCWTWKGRAGTTGYGSFTATHGRTIGAHRFSWELHNGQIPVGLFVCHRCDNRICVRPDHLFLGTATDNIRDAKQKQRIAIGDRNGNRTHPERRPRGESHGMRTHPERIPRGERNGRARLTTADVRRIRALHAAGVPVRTIAPHFNVSPWTIWAILNGRNWASVP